MITLTGTNFAHSAGQYCVASKESSIKLCVARAIFVAVCFLVIQSMAFTAKAATTCKRDNGSSHSATIDVVNVPRDQGVNTKITQWQTMPGGNARFFSCVTDGGTVGAHWYNHSMASTGTTHNDGSVDYTVWKTNVTGIGIIVRTKYAQGTEVVNGTVPCFTSYTTWSGWFELSWQGGNACSVAANSQYVYYGGDTQFALIKTGDFTDGSKVQVSNGWRMSPQVNNDYHWGGTNLDHLYSVTATVVNVLRCQTPDISVPLGDHAPSEFTAVGSRSKAVKFDLKINSCSKGMGSVHYGFNVASGTTYTAKEGLVSLSPSSTAKGVQVKLMKGDGTTTVEFDKWIQLTDYKSGVGGTYSVPLSAAYQRTGDVTAGSANAELVIAMYYQ